MASETHGPRGVSARAAFQLPGAEKRYIPNMTIKTGSRDSTRMSAASSGAARKESSGDRRSGEHHRQHEAAHTGSP